MHWFIGRVIDALFILIPLGVMAYGFTRSKPKPRCINVSLAARLYSYILQGATKRAHLAGVSRGQWMAYISAEEAFFLDQLGSILEEADESSPRE